MSVSAFYLLWCSTFFPRAVANDDSTRTLTVAREAMVNTTPTEPPRNPTPMANPPMARALMARPMTWSKEMAAMVSDCSVESVHPLLDRV